MHEHATHSHASKQEHVLREREVRVAVDGRTAELYDEQLRLRGEAQTAERRATFLAEATTLLSSSLDYERTLEAVA